MTENKSLLITMDYQNDYVDSQGKVAKKLKTDLIDNQKILPSIKRVINKWRSENNSILFIMNDYNVKNYKGAFKKHRAKGAYGNTALQGTWGHELYKIIPEKSDKIIVKNFPHGYYKTNLEKYLKSLNPSKIYFTGINTDVCVFHTAFYTALLGYETYVIEDATAGTTKKNKKIYLNHLEKIAGIKIIKSNSLL